MDNVGAKTEPPVWDVVRRQPFTLARIAIISHDVTVLESHFARLTTHPSNDRMAYVKKGSAIQLTEHGVRLVLKRV
jgi:hypothetical protein